MPLPGPAPTQKTELGDGVLEGRDDLLDPGQDDVDRRDGRGHPAVALVGAEHHRSALGDQRVRAGHADPGGEELGPDQVADRVDLLRDVINGNGDLELGVEELADVLPAEVEGRSDDVARPLVQLLDEPLADVGLDALDVARLEVVVELHLLADHRTFRLITTIPGPLHQPVG